MRALQWAVGAVVAATVAATAACGTDEVRVTPAGAATGGACAQQGARCVDSGGATAAARQGSAAEGGSDAAGVTDGQGAGVRIGPNGVTVTDGRGSDVSVDGRSASVNADSGVVADRGTTGTVELGGAVSWQGAVTASCSRVADTRSIDAQLPDSGRLQVQTSDASTATVELAQQGRSWDATYVGDAADVITLANGSTQLRGVRLAGGGGTVDVTATFDC